MLNNVNLDKLRAAMEKAKKDLTILIYCLYGVASCFAAIFATIAAKEGVELRKLKIFRVLWEADAGKEKIQEDKSPRSAVPLYTASPRLYRYRWRSRRNSS